MRIHPKMEEDRKQGISKKKILHTNKSGRSFNCSKCPYTSEKKTNLLRHVQTMHDLERTFTCCGIIFQNKADYRQHSKMVHKNGHKCPVCSRVFNRRALLSRHLNVHTGHREFACSSCTYASSHKSNLDRHMKTHLKGGPSGGSSKGGTLSKPKAIKKVKPLRSSPPELPESTTMSGGSGNDSFQLSPLPLIVKPVTKKNQKLVKPKAILATATTTIENHIPIPKNKEITYSIESILNSNESRVEGTRLNFNPCFSQPLHVQNPNISQLYRPFYLPYQSLQQPPPPPPPAHFTPPQPPRYGQFGWNFTPGYPQFGWNYATPIPFGFPQRGLTETRTFPCYPLNYYYTSSNSL